MKAFLISVFALLLAFADQPAIAFQGATTNIEGLVVDTRGLPVNQAFVSLRSGSVTVATTVTDSNGKFQLSSRRTGPLVLAITCTGFDPQELAVDQADQSSRRVILSPASVLAEVTIAATRSETRLGETPTSVVILNSTDLETTAAATLDDALRQVAGFSLFRRSGSRTANPTSQGVSLRGVGASGASRALVLADGVPLNDPFGGWVYWNRVPRESIREVEVVQGAASHLYGSTALGGVISVSTRRPSDNAMSLSMSYGNERTANGSLYLSGIKNRWAASVAAEVFHTDGYVLVPLNQRGQVDTRAGSRNAVTNLSLERELGEDRWFFGRATFSGEARQNGTPLQTNRTHLRQFVLGGNWATFIAGKFSAYTYGGTQTFDQNFSAVSIDRNSETLTRVQRVPAQAMGLSFNWTRSAGKLQSFVAGGEVRGVRGASDEIAYANGRASSFVGAGGRQTTAGVYLEDLLRIGSRLFLNVGGRYDRWRNYAALSSTRPVTAINPTSVIPFPDRLESAFSPQASAVLRINDQVALMASASRAFRAPTLNELYRSFRVGNVLTLANERLLAERLTGGDAGVRLSLFRQELVLRGAFFWNIVNRPVANVTLSTTPALITRQRQNLGRTQSRGFELQTDAAINNHWSLSSGYLFADATVVRFPPNPALEGLLIPQLPRRQFTFQTRYSNPSLLTVAIQGRAATKQYDDDLNQLPLAAYFTVDAFISRRLNRRLEAFVAIENIFNQRYEIGSTPVTTVGPPTLVRCGFRLQVGKQ